MFSLNPPYRQQSAECPKLHPVSGCKGGRKEGEGEDGEIEKMYLLPSQNQSRVGETDTDPEVMEITVKLHLGRVR